jgi:molybdopterin-guanine dinucleotide biosynthesis protein A
LKNRNLKISIGAIILAGGKSSRMGRDKGLMKVGGVAMVQCAIQSVANYADNIVVMSSNPEYRITGMKLLPDQIQDKGPLSGLVSGMQYLQKDAYVVLTCDTPLLNEAFVEFLINRYLESSAEAVVPEVNGKMYPLTAIYSASTLSFFSDCLLRDELSVRRCLEKMNIEKIVIDRDEQIFPESIFRNVNTIEDYNKMIKDYAG